MDKASLIEQTRAYLEEKFNDESSGHDYWHMYRVWQLAKRIAKSEKDVDTLTLELAALLHDVADWKFHDGDKEAGPRAARKWLEGLDVNDTTIYQVQEIMRNVPFRGKEFEDTLSVSIESQILYDADNLDAIGSIGIGRAFAYVGAKGRPMYNPNEPIRQFNEFKDYSQSITPSAINHFYERLLLLKDRMFTKTGKELAQHRHKVMEAFLEEFLAEWDGKR